MIIVGGSWNAVSATRCNVWAYESVPVPPIKINGGKASLALKVLMSILVVSPSR